MKGRVNNHAQITSIDVILCERVRQALRVGGSTDIGCSGDIPSVVECLQRIGQSDNVKVKIVPVRLGLNRTDEDASLGHCMCTTVKVSFDPDISRPTFPLH